MKTLTIFSILIGSFILFLSGCNTHEKTEKKNEIVISAAASLNGALEEVKKEYQNKHDNITIHMNYGGSGKLSQQIIQGAPVDIFLSAAEEPFNQVKDKKLLENDKKLFSNSLVLVTLKENKTNINDFQGLLSNDIEKIGIGTPEFVPAGLYAKQTLQHLGIWGKVQKKLIFTQDVSQVLHYVETGNTEAGLVYKTDALLSNKVKIIAKADPNWHDPIFYFGGALKNSKEKAEAIKFLQFLTSEDAKKIFAQYGFQPL